MEQALDHGLAISFLNARSAFDDPVAAARWWGATYDCGALAGPDRPKPRFDAGLAAELRALQAAALTALAPGDVPADSALAVLSAALARGSLRVAGVPPRLEFCATDGIGTVLFPLAHAVASLLGSADQRLRTCANQACGAYFWDGTKNGSRRWCRLSCMEQARAPRRRLQR